MYADWLAKQGCCCVSFAFEVLFYCLSRSFPVLLLHLSFLVNKSSNFDIQIKPETDCQIVQIMDYGKEYEPLLLTQAERTC